MLIITNYSKAQNLDPKLIRFGSISRELTKNNNDTITVTQMMDLCPSMELLSKLDNKEISKKKFLKKYKKFLNSDQAGLHLYGIGLALQESDFGICLFCSDDEWDLGYMNVLKEKIEKLFGITVVKSKDGSKILKKAMSNIPKKLRKKDDSKKYRKAVTKIMKEVKKEYNVFSSDGEDNFSSMRKHYAIDQIFSSAIQEGLMTIDDKGEVGIHEDVVKDKMKKASFVNAILAAAKSSKKYKKVIEEVFENHSTKLKSLEKLNKSEILCMLAECVNAIQKERCDIE